jgi:tRNA pseudouridine38-40 synthase
LSEAEVESIDASTAAQAREQRIIALRFTANGFLHHMIRNIVGALVRVGTGQADPAWFAALLASRDRTQGAQTFSAAGLYLTGVQYPSQFGLPHMRAVRSRPLLIRG